VESCPTHALQFCEVQQWSSQRRRTAAKGAADKLARQGKNNPGEKK
jgi:hypothetical protein